MATTADRLRTYWGDRQFERERLSGLAVRYWEVGLFVALVGVALVMRLWNLDVRAYHHDEGIHSWYSWLLAEGKGYEHDPVYHGPFHIMITAAIYKLPFLGDSDVTGRLLPALFGTALVAMPYFLRDFLGRTGALFAALLIAVSPVLLYLSRFAHYDAHIAFFTFGLAIVIWRYLKEQKQAYLYGVPLFLMLGFVTKETTFITTAVFLAFLEIRLANDLVDQLRASRELSRAEVALAYAVLLPTAWLVAALWPLLERVRRRWSLDSLPASGHLVVIMGTFALPQFAAAVQKLPFVEDGGYMGERSMMMTTVFITIIATAYIGLLWNPRVWGWSALIFYLPFFLFYTSFLTEGGDLWNVTSGGRFWTGEGGFWTGTWGSLDYWLQQQYVERGNQPEYYYLMFLPVYEFLPLVFAIGGAFYYAFKGRLEQQLLTISAVFLILLFSLFTDSIPLVGKYHVHAAFFIALGAVLLLSMDGFTKFLIFWTLSMLFAFSVAGERMPWLTANIALPLALLGAKVLDDILSSVGRRAAPEAAPVEPRATRRRAARKEPEPPPYEWAQWLPLAYGAVFAIVAAIVFQTVGPTSPWAALAWLASLGALGVVVWAAGRSWRVAGQVAAMALFAAFLVFTIRAGGTAAFDQGGPLDSPPELLIYAQGSPGLTVVRDAIEDRAQALDVGHNIRIVLDNSEDTNDWPWPWYLRNYRNVGYDKFQGSFVPERNSVVLISKGNEDKLEPWAEYVEQKIEYTHMWWFPTFYSGLDVDQFLGDLFTGHYTSIWRNYFIDRTVPGATSSTDRVAYFFGDFEPTDVTPPPTTTPSFEGVLDPAAQTIIGGPGDGEREFAQPADLAFDAEGNLYVVDTLNQRIQRLAASGATDAFGEHGSGDGQFLDPGRDGEFAADGPWGVVVDSQGFIYVADTWNHRIQKFSPDLEFVQVFASGLFGPRDLAFDADGSLLVVDTGNKRVVKYSPDGQEIQAYGVDGRSEGQFNEPSSISIAPNGDILVADYWNRRVQRFDRQFTFVSQFYISTWGSHGVTDRAYIVALADGTILATDPANGAVLVFDATGAWRASWKLAAAETPTRPIGIAVDAQNNVYVADSLGSQVRVIPLSALLAIPQPAAPQPTPTAQATQATP